MTTAIYSLITALVIGLLIAPGCIPLLRAMKFGQRIRSDGPQSHLQKAGTPTMGGIIFILAMVISILIWSKLSPEILWVTGAVIGFGLLGFLDDYIKVVLKRPLGLTARQKIVGQIFLACLFTYGASHFLGRGTDLELPLHGGVWNLGAAYYFLAVVLVVGTTNAVNLTDGLDGLAGGISLLVYLGLAVICLAAAGTSPTGSMDYGELAIAAAALAGGCLAFLHFNHYPARIFMGDTGSLALGGGIAALAILSRTELVLPVLGGVYVLETLSVVLQVLSFRLTGKRIFRMSPLHHHFELLGWPETKVVHLFWSSAAVFVALGLVLGLL